MIIQGMNATPTVAPTTSTAALQGVTRLTHLGVILAQGADAASFLQGQLTQDVLTMAPGESRLAAFCSAKGRMLASFQVIKQADAQADAQGNAVFLLVCSRDILAATCKRLSMFVMRAKAQLRDASADYAVYGVSGVDGVDGVQGVQGVNGVLSGVPDGASATQTAPRIVVQPLADAPPPGTELGLDHWLWAEVRSGIGRITLPTVEAFVPQMLNYESVGGVNFKKGCYPGQEVVARSQFRGTLKRRAYLVHMSGPGPATSAEQMAPGAAVFGPADATQPCGTVVLAAAMPDRAGSVGGLGDAGGSGGVGASSAAGAANEGFDAIVSMQVAAADAGGLTLGSADGPPLELLALPYALLDDI